MPCHVIENCKFYVTTGKHFPFNANLCILTTAFCVCVCLCVANSITKDELILWMKINNINFFEICYGNFLQPDTNTHTHIK